jgi:RimJ/RimL family protein N-acetyltransferase
MSLETERLTFRPPRLADAAPLFEFLGDSTAMQYTTVQDSLRDCRRYEPRTNGNAAASAVPLG